LFDEIGIAISNARPSGIPRVKRADKHCFFVGQARDGHMFYAQSDDVSCPLARFNLGLDAKSDKNLLALARTLVDWGDAKTEEIALRYLNSAHTLPLENKYIIYFPMPYDKLLLPSVIVMLGSSKKFMSLVQIITRLTGKRTEGILSGVGAMCGECTAIPILTGKTNISLACGGSRPQTKLEDSELFMALPSKVYNILEPFLKHEL